MRACETRKRSCLTWSPLLSWYSVGECRGPPLLTGWMACLTGWLLSDSLDTDLHHPRLPGYYLLTRLPQALPLKSCVTRQGSLSWPSGAYPVTSTNRASDDYSKLISQYGVSQQLKVSMFFFNIHFVTSNHSEATILKWFTPIKG